MAITVTTTPTQKDLETIVQLLKNEPALTPRSLASLQDNTVVIARDGKKVIGWVVSEHLYGTVYELGAAYVVPAHRGSGVLGQLLDGIMKDSQTYVAAVFSPALLQYVVTQRGFSEASLRHVIAVSHWRFITKRFRTSGRVAKHVSKSKPLFVIREAING